MKFWGTNGLWEKKELFRIAVYLRKDFALSWGIDYEEMGSKKKKTKQKIQRAVLRLKTFLDRTRQFEKSKKFGRESMGRIQTTPERKIALASQNGKNGGFRWAVTQGLFFGKRGSLVFEDLDLRPRFNLGILRG